MRSLALAILAIGMASAAGPARAQTYGSTGPVCMHVIQWGGGEYYNCSFVTMAQCAGSAMGLGATCGINPYYAGASAYAGPSASPGRRERRYRHVYCAQSGAGIRQADQVAAEGLPPARRPAATAAARITPAKASANPRQNPLQNPWEKPRRRLPCGPGLAIVAGHKSRQKRLAHTPTLPSMVLSRQGDSRPANRESCP
jgi:hypothetical protein